MWIQEEPDRHCAVVTAQGPSGGQSWDLLIVPHGGESILEMVQAFLAARRGGAGAEVFLTRTAIREFGLQDVAPLYEGRDGGAYINSSVVFLDGPRGDPGSWEVGVSSGGE